MAHCPCAKWLVKKPPHSTSYRRSGTAIEAHKRVKAPAVTRGTSAALPIRQLRLGICRVSDGGEKNPKKNSLAT